MSGTVPDVAFLGIADRARFIQEERYGLWHTQILGVRDILVPMVYPFSFAGRFFVLGIFDPFNFEPARLVFVGDDGTEAFECDLRLQPTTGEEVGDDELPGDVSPQVRQVLTTEVPTWTLFTMPGPAGLIQAPGKYHVLLRRGATDLPLATLVLGIREALALTPERRAAILSDPLGFKAVRVTIQCHKCGEGTRAYAGLDRSESLEDLGYTWYEDVPDRFQCKCGKTAVGLAYIRSHLHGFLGERYIDEGGLSTDRLYDKRALEDVSRKFVRLLDRNPLEAPVQRFLEKNPVLLQTFSPARLWLKPTIIGEYQADFAVLNAKGELLLIEIEAPGRLILTKKGKQAAPLTHAIGQVTDWLHVIDEERSAVLRGFSLDQKEVTKVRGVAIVGRDKGYDKSHLRRLKSADLGRVDFYTFDDLVRSLEYLVQSMESL